MNLNIPDLNHSFSLITVRGITRTLRSKLVQDLLNQLGKFCSELSKTKEVGFTTVIDTHPCRVTFTVTPDGVNVRFTGDADKADPIDLVMNGVSINLNSIPASNSTIATVITSLLLKNTQE